MKESNRWARCSFALLLVGCIFAGILVGSSSSQDVRRAIESTEVGRYQYVNGGMIFDTKTARLWRAIEDGQNQKWVRDDAPWESNQKPKSQPNGIAPSGNFIGHGPR